MLTIGTILHPTDFSECSNYGFQLACSLAKVTGAKIHVLHVGRCPPNVPVDQFYEKLEAMMHELQADDPKIPVEHQLDFVGDPAPEILRVAQSIKADLIVMGTRGQTTDLGRLLIGSIADHVVRKARCPVVTVKIPVHEMGPSEESTSKGANRSGGSVKRRSL